jgi:hypothetical protein
VALGRLKRRWENNTRLGLREIICEAQRWTEQLQDHVKWWAFMLAVLKLLILYQRVLPVFLKTATSNIPITYEHTC